MRYVEINARNVLFTNSDEHKLQFLYKRANNDFVKKYLKTTFRNYLVNDYSNVKVVNTQDDTTPSWVEKAIEKGDTVYKLNINGRDMIKWEHYIDYLNTLPPRPIKMSFTDLEHHVKEWEKSFAKQKADQEDGIELLHDYKNGFKWVKVFGKNSLVREGKLMKHCVGSYYNDVQDKKCEIYSLRDENNIPHVTIEYGKGFTEHNHTVRSGQVIKQIKGNSNQPPKDEYIKYVNDFLKKKYVKYTDVQQTDLILCGLFYQDNQIYKLESMPEGFVIKDDLNLDDLDKDIKLPKGLVVNGFLSIEDSVITTLPENLTVKGMFYASNSKLEYVPKSCIFEKDIDISKSNVTKWEISECKNNFLAQESSLTYLPDNFIVHGDCHLTKTEISYIKNITVDGDLHLDECKYLDYNSIGFINVGDALYLPHDFPYIHGDKIVAGYIYGGREIEPEYDEYEEEDE